MILTIYAILSVIMLILYHRTKYAKRIPDKWKGKSTIRLALYYVLRSVLFLIVWPGLVAHLYIPKFQPILEIKIKYEKWKYSRHTYLCNNIGVGAIECKECGHKERVILAVHHQVDCDYRLGYQCQKCGKHIAIADPFKYKKLPECECGGKLSRKKPVFCSECGSKNEVYHRIYIT